MLKLQQPSRPAGLGGRLAVPTAHAVRGSALALAAAALAMTMVRKAPGK